MATFAEYRKKDGVPHLRHDEHLCYMENMGYLTGYLTDYKELIKNPEFVCKKCGRAAKSKDNLCQPDKI